MRFWPFVLCLLLTCDLPAQMGDISSQLQLGQSEKAPNGSRIARVIKANNQGLQVLRFQPSKAFSPEKYWIEQYNSQFNLIQRSELLLPEATQIDVEDLFHLNGRLYLLSSRIIEEEQVSRLMLRPISATGQVMDADQVLAEVSLDDKFRRRQFDLEFSRDSSRLLLYNQIPTEKGENEQFTFRVFDDQFNLLWSRDEMLAYPDHQFDVLTYQLDANGNVVLLGRLRAESKLIPPVYTVFVYTNEGKTVIEYPIAFEEKTVRNLIVEFLSKDKIACAGFYSDEQIGPEDGVYFLHINFETQEWSPAWVIPLSGDLLTSQEDVSNRMSLPFRPRSLTPRSDGGVVLVAEQYRKSSRRIGPPTGLQTQKIYNYGDLLIMNMNGEGKLDWGCRIPKNQSTLDDSGVFSSFSQVTISDRFYFMYNDHPKNFRPNQARRHPMTNKNAVVALTEITRSGELTTVPLLMNEDVPVVILPRMCKQVNSRQLLLYGQSGRNYSFGLLSFE